MKQTVTANISGIIFHVEVDAFEKLEQYLSTIRSYFENVEGQDEIMTDIEARIAEISKNAKAEVVRMEEVKLVIETMGEPEQFIEDNAENQSAKSKQAPPRRKKLFRDTEDSLIGGVCSGLGHFFGIDKIWFRAAFLIAVFVGFGSGVIVYLILWIIVPSPANAAEKLEMKGESVNVNSIGKIIKEEFESLKKKVDQNNEGSFSRKLKHGLLKVVQFFSNLLHFILKFLGKFIALILLIFSASTLLTLLFATIMGPINLNFNNISMNLIDWADFRALFFHSDLAYWSVAIGLVLFLIIPLFGLLFLSIKVLFNLSLPAKNFSIISFALWVVSLIALLLGVGFSASHFASKAELDEVVPLGHIETDSLHLNIKPFQEQYSKNIVGLQLSEDKIYNNEVLFEFVAGRKSTYQLILVKESRGKNKQKAKELAEAVNIDFKIVEDTLSFSPYWWTNRSNKFSFQELTIQLAVPIGKQIYIPQEMSHWLAGIKNMNHMMHPQDMVEHYWIMTPKGLKCIDCEWRED